jgi:hypothetical protein
LQLLPGHPDGVAGLGHFEVVQAKFAPLVAAISAALAASLAADIGGGKMVLEASYPSIAALLLVDTALFVAPLLVFMPALAACRLRGLSEYTEFAERYVRDFELKWLGSAPEANEPVLGSSDIQSMADLGTSVERVEAMRLAPVSVRLLIVLLAAALLPLLPLALFKIPLVELVRQVVTRLTGL